MKRIARHLFTRQLADSRASIWWIVFSAVMLLMALFSVHAAIQSVVDLRAVEAIKPLDAADAAHLQQRIELRRQTIPTWIWSAALISCIASVSAYIAVRRWRADRAMKRGNIGLCPRCGYDLRASPDRCPECGTIPSAKAAT
jgi:hypothetical protein